MRYLASFRGGCYGNTTIDWETPYAKLYVPVARHLPIEWLFPPCTDHDVYGLSFEGTDERGISRLIFQYESSYRLPLASRRARFRKWIAE